MTSSAPRFDHTATELRIDDTGLHVVLADGRELSIPLAWYPKLAAATPEQRNNWRWIGGGVGIHWPDLDEDLSIRGMLGA